MIAPGSEMKDPPNDPKEPPFTPPPEKKPPIEEPPPEKKSPMGDPQPPEKIKTASWQRQASSLH